MARARSSQRPQRGRGGAHGRRAAARRPNRRTPTRGGSRPSAPRRPKCARSWRPRREEAQTTITTEAQETERLRAELEAAREETERTVSAERAETARLREELAARSANGEDAGEAEAAARRMYERIARELENERAAARSLRRELDAVQAQTAEHRRVVSAAATANGIDTSDDAPAAATPAGRLAAARRTEVGRAAAHHRAGAARAAAAHRVPEAHRSPLIRGAAATAVAFLVGLLIALLIIVRLVG